jgi:hypothetical protein
MHGLTGEEALFTFIVNDRGESLQALKPVILRTHKRTKCNSFPDACRGAICLIR